MKSSVKVWYHITGNDDAQEDKQSKEKVSDIYMVGISQ